MTPLNEILVAGLKQSIFAGLEATSYERPRITIPGAMTKVRRRIPE